MSIYRLVGKEFAAHERVAHEKGNYANDRGFTTNHVENFFGVFKHIMKTHIHIENQHLQRYLSETAFRYGRVKHVRKTDELLRYLHHARNSDLHGLSSSYKSNLNAPVLETVKSASEVDKSKGEFLLRLNTGQPEPWLIKAKFSSSIKLIPVIDDRDKSVFPVPQNHMGQKLPGMKIPAVAALALTFFEGIIAEAEALIV